MEQKDNTDLKDVVLANADYYFKDMHEDYVLPNALPECQLLAMSLEYFGVDRKLLFFEDKEGKKKPFVKS